MLYLQVIYFKSRNMVKRRLISGLIVLMMLYLMVYLGRSIWRLQQAGGRVDEAEWQLKQLARENYELSRKLAEVDSTEYMVKEIRDKLHLVRPGEQVVLLPEELPKVVVPEPIPTVEEKQNWRLWWERFR